MEDREPLREQVIALVNRYVGRGYLYGGELLLPRQDALAMAEEFTDLGIAIIFINAWTVTQTEYGPRFSLLYGCGLAPPLGKREDDTERLLRARVVTLAMRVFDPYPVLPDLVSLRPDIPMEWDVFHRRSPLFVWSRDDTSWWKGPQDEERRSPIPPSAPPRHP